MATFVVKGFVKLLGTFRVLCALMEELSIRDIPERKTKQKMVHFGNNYVLKKDARNDCKRDKK